MIKLICLFIIIAYWRAMFKAIEHEVDYFSTHGFKGNFDRLAKVILGSMLVALTSSIAAGLWG